MKKVYIRYNPYRLETEITVDDKNLAQNSKLGEKIDTCARLQEWVEELPKILVDEYNDTNFEIIFHGTVLDFEDLSGVLYEGCLGPDINFRLEHEPAKETADKEGLIDEVFKRIQDGPFDELSDPEIISSFELAKSSDFEVCVVATMSAGKSTLINALIGSKLMPSKQEACTAIITRLKDISDNEMSWHAEVFDKEEQLIETHQNLAYTTMEKLNANELVSEIKVGGNIPFVSSEDVSLVLIDTPGPNNSRDPHHRKVQSEFLGKSSKALILYIMTGEFGTDDDNSLLKRVAESMSVGGKQSKDRFIFVINKLDDRKKEDGDTSQTLDRVRAYLKTHGVANPNLFPAAALPALNLRLLSNGSEVDEDTKDETAMKIRKLNRNETLHFEKYTSLPASIRKVISQQLEDARERKSPDGEALIHTGITSLEAAIRQYVQKYAKTAKIKNIVDTFMHKLDELGCFEEAKRELAMNRNESERIIKQINLIRNKIDDVELVKEFKDAVDDAVVKVNDDSQRVVEVIIKKFQTHITKKIDEMRDKEMDVNDATNEIELLDKFSIKLIPDFEVELEDLVRNSLTKTSSSLLEEYRQKLVLLSEDIEFGDKSISIAPLKFMGNSVKNNFSYSQLIHQEKRVIGNESYTEKIQSRGWFKGIVFWPKNEYITKKKKIYDTVEFINGSELSQEFLAPMQEAIYNNGNIAQKYAVKQSNLIAESFYTEFKRLDELLKVKLSELESYASDQKLAEQRIAESEYKLDWLHQIRTNLETILEI